MGVSWSQRFLGAITVAVLAVGIGAGQQSTADDSKRKIKTKMNPQYSDLARRMSLTAR